MLALVLLGVGFVLASWYPFQLDLPRVVENDARRTADGGWSFDGSGLAVTETPPAWLGDIAETTTLTLELEFRSGGRGQHGPARLVSLAPGPERGADVAEQNLMVGQRGDGLEIRVRQQSSGGPSQARLVTVDGIEPGRWQRLSVRLDDELTLTIDGREHAVTTLEAGWPESWPRDVLLSLGNTSSGLRPWRGELRRAELTTVHSTVDLLAEPGLTVPDPLRLVPTRLTEMRQRTLERSPAVWAMHLVTGLALGALLTLARPSWRRVRVVGALLLFVVVVNAGKIVVLERHPSLTATGLQALGIVAATLAVGSAGRRRVGEDPAVGLGRREGEQDG
jgi:hypothetical protein